MHACSPPPHSGRGRNGRMRILHCSSFAFGRLASVSCLQSFCFFFGLNRVMAQVHFPEFFLSFHACFAYGGAVGYLKLSWQPARWFILFSSFFFPSPPSFLESYFLFRLPLLLPSDLSLSSEFVVTISSSFSDNLNFRGNFFSLSFFSLSSSS